MKTFDDPIVTASYGVQWRKPGADRWQTAGRTWGRFDKALVYGQRHADTYKEDEVRMVKSEIRIETVWMAVSPKIRMTPTHPSLGNHHN